MFFQARCDAAEAHWITGQALAVDGGMIRWRAAEREPYE